MNTHPEIQPIFETERLQVRPYLIDDFEHFFRINSDEEIIRYIRPAQNREQSIEFFYRILADYGEQPGLGRWGMYERKTNEFVGSFAVIPVKNSTDIQLGYALLQPYWGLGYASESVKGGIEYAFTRLDLESIAGITEAGNFASQKVLTRNGFSFEKTFTEEKKLLHVYRILRPVDTTV